MIDAVIIQALVAEIDFTDALLIYVFAKHTFLKYEVARDRLVMDAVII